MKMKGIKAIGSILLCLMILCAMSAAVWAAEDNGYTYTVRVYAGAQGEIDGGKAVITESGLRYGDSWTFDMSRVTVTNEKYYAKGVRESGDDNSALAMGAFEVKKDVDLVIAYGVKGDKQTSYTLHFVNYANGEELEGSATYYGNVGDKPVVAYKFIDGF